MQKKYCNCFVFLRDTIFFELIFYVTLQTRCGHEVLNNLLQNRQYSIVLHSYSTARNGTDLVYEMSETLRIRTKHFNRPDPVRNFTLKGYSFGDKNLNVSVSWNGTNGEIRNNY